MPQNIGNSISGHRTMNHILKTIYAPIKRKKVMLKSGVSPVKPKLTGYSLKSAVIKRSRKAVLKNWAKKVM